MKWQDTYIMKKDMKSMNKIKRMKINNVKLKKRKRNKKKMDKMKKVDNSNMKIIYDSSCQKTIRWIKKISR